MFDGFGRDPVGLSREVALLQELVAAARGLLVGARLDLSADRAVAAALQLQKGRAAHEPALARREVFPFVVEAGVRGREEDARRFLNRRGDTAQELNLLLERHRPRIDLERHLPGLVGLLHRRQPNVLYFFATALARAMSVATPATRSISSGVTSGLLANPRRCRESPEYRTRRSRRCRRHRVHRSHRRQNGRRQRKSDRF